MKRLIVCGSLIVVLAAGAGFAADESNVVLRVLDAIKRDRLDAAEDAFAVALKEFPDSIRVNALHGQLAEMNAEKEHWPEAVSHLTAYIDHQLAKVGDLPTAAKDIPALVAQLCNLQEHIENARPTAETFDLYLKKLREQSEARPGQELTVAISELTVRKVSWLAQNHQTDAARELLEQELRAAAGDHQQDEQDLGAILRLAAALRAQAQLADELSPEKADVHRERYRTFLTDQTQAHPDEIAIVGACLNAQLAEIQELALADPDKAKDLIDALAKFMQEFKDPRPAVKRRFNQVRQNLSAIEPRLEAARAHLALVGQQGPLPETDAWLNGAPLAARDLAGKVVLLDFWAVWCGPCIATFPHLREWHEKFADKGLVIVGVTHYYNYDWDEQANRIKPEKDLSHERECAATEKFLAFHNLKHRIAVIDRDAKFDENYLVRGIPQAVLLDRQGKVRLIRVGSGPKNAKDLERMIEALLAEPPAAGG